MPLTDAIDAELAIPFLVKVTGVSGSDVSFAEWWLTSAGTVALKAGGRYGGSNNPGRSVNGYPFATGDFALCRSAPGTGGTKWELYPLPTAPAATPAVSAWKEPVRVATTTAGTLASSFENGDTVDGVTLATGDRILVKNQAAGAENGIYTVNASGAPTRAADANVGSQLVSAGVMVAEGTVNKDTFWTCTNNSPITLGTTALAFAQIRGDVVGPASATNRAVCIFDGTTGKLIKECALVADATGTSFSGPIIMQAEQFAAAGPGNSTFASGVILSGPFFEVTAGELRLSALTAAATTPGAVIKKLPVYNSTGSGVPIGYIPIYNTIT